MIHGIAPGEYSNITNQISSHLEPTWAINVVDDFVGESTANTILSQQDGEENEYCQHGVQ